MNSIRKIIKEQLLNERAGISEIVRKWAVILKNEVDEQQKLHREEQAKKRQEQKPTPKPTTGGKQLSLDFDEDDDILDVELGGGSDPKNDPFYWEDETSKGKGSKKWDDDLDDEFYFRNYYGSGKGYYKRGYGNDFGGSPSYRGGFGGSYTPMVYYEPLKEVVVYGDSFPEEYEEFSVDMWVLTNSNRIEYDHYKSGYAESGEYIVYLNIPLGSMSMSAFIHEIKHAYDDWNRMRSGGKPIRDSWEIKNIYTKDFEKLILGGSATFPQLGPIVRNYYMGSKLESPAYLENEYDGTDYQDIGRKLMNFKASTYFNKEGNPARGLEEEFRKLQEYDIPFFKTFKSVTDFLKYTEKYFNKRGTDIFKRVNKMRAVHGLTPKHKQVYQKYEPKTTTTSTTKKEVEEEPYEEGEEIGDWKFSKERGWYYIGEDDAGNDYR